MSSSPDSSLAFASSFLSSCSFPPPSPVCSLAVACSLLPFSTMRVMDLAVYCSRESYLPGRGTVARTLPSLAGLGLAAVLV